MVQPLAFTVIGASVNSSAGAVFVDPPADATRPRGRAHARYLRGWSLACPSKRTPGPPTNGTVVDERGIEAELGRQRRFLLERFPAVARPAERAVQIAGHPLEPAGDLLGAYDRVDLRDRREPRVPHRLRVIAAEMRARSVSRCVDDHRQVRARVAGVDLRAAFPLDHATFPPPPADRPR